MVESTIANVAIAVGPEKQVPQIGGSDFKRPQELLHSSKENSLEISASLRVYFLPTQTFNLRAVELISTFVYLLSYSL